MQVILAAAGGGSPHTMTESCRQALEAAPCIIGARRLLDSLPEGWGAQRIAATRPGEILAAIQSSGEERCLVLYSGDTGFYSGAKGLLPLLEEADIPCQVLPGLSSVQLLAAALGRPWQDWLLVSAHGTDCDPVGAVMQGRPVFFLTGGELGPAELCQKLARAGLGDLPVTVGEELSYPGQQVRRGTAGDFAEERFSPLSVLLAEPAPGVARRAPGFPDSWFLRGEAPMTKREVRAAILARLDPRPGEVFWDVGAGTGSVSIELALAASRGRAYAIECGEAACGLIRQNRERLGAWNLQVVQGCAPQALEGLEPPDGVFIGGTKGELEQVVDLVLARNPRAKLCVSAICVETLYRAVKALEGHGIQPEIAQVGVSRGRAAGGQHLLLAHNPVFLIAGNCDG